MAADSQPFERGGRVPVARLGGPGPFRRFMLSSMASLSYPGTQAEQLLLAPQELRTADPSFATELYNGHFGLAGRLAEVEAESPFEIAPPSEGWARELYGFGWLRHLRAADSELSREQAKALVNDFITLKRSIHPLAWQPEIVGRRVISWLSNSVLILDSGEPQAYEIFLKALTSQLRYLSASYRDAPDGVPRLVALMALIYAGLCIAEQQAVVERYSRPFCKELERQILPDGGHISRNPDALVELLLDLLPLRQCFVARDRAPPKELTDAIDRIMPMLRFFRTGDGTLARFNGAGPTQTDALATVLAYDDVEGKPVRAATNSGYVRAGMRADRADLRYRARARALAQQHCACGLLLLRAQLGGLPDHRQLRVAVARSRRVASLCPLHPGALDAQFRGVLLRGVHGSGQQWRHDCARLAADRPAQRAGRVRRSGRQSSDQGRA
jgi:uncharacterized heparinase superfamily protein